LSSEDLLRPTLSGYRQAPAIYSSTGFFLATFFGGPVGAAVYASFNSYRLGRWSADLPVYVALAAAPFFVVLLLFKNGDLARGTVEVALRALALACFGAIYLMHRKFFRSARVAGVKPLSSWTPGILAVLLGYLANTAFILGILEHH
jgi:hypothetical protein